MTENEALKFGKALYKNMTSGATAYNVDKERLTKALLDSRRFYFEGYEDAKRESGWIPVSERLPEEGIDVLVWFEYFRYGEYDGLYQTTGISYTYRGDWSGFVNGQSGWHQLRIIAWMPLPEPYQQKGCD